MAAYPIGFGSKEPSMTAVTAGAFIFDMDGTLVDNMAYHTQSWLRLFAELGIEMTSDRLDCLMGSHTTPVMLKSVLGQHTSGAEIATYSERKEAIYRAVYGPHLTAVAGVRHFLGEAQAQGIPIAVATSAGRRNIEFTLGGLGIKAGFDAIVGGDDVPQGKSGPEIFLTTAQRLGIDPEQCLVFEDSRSGVEAAQLAGMRIMVIATNPKAEEFRALPSVIGVVSDFSALEPLSLITMLGHSGDRGAHGRGMQAVQS
jgi:HAD superfamily hydrolase (TIGR01509 family)